jgi:hypothetical protein
MFSALNEGNGKKSEGRLLKEEKNRMRERERERERERIQEWNRGE